MSIILLKLRENAFIRNYGPWPETFFLISLFAGGAGA
jgi:hypothetical protein